VCCCRCCCFRCGAVLLPRFAHTATRCNTLQHSATHCNTLQHTATHCNTLQHTATHCNALQRTAMPCDTLQRTCALRHNICDAAVSAAVLFISQGLHMLQHTATHCKMLQHTATLCNAPAHCNATDLMPLFLLRRCPAVGVCPHCNTRKNTATCRNTLQRTCVLPHTSTQRNWCCCFCCGAVLQSRSQMCACMHVHVCVCIMCVYVDFVCVHCLSLHT